jgi:hypothetical protein
MVTVYREYTRDRIGLVFGLRGGQLIGLGLGALPVFMCLQRGLWTAALAAFGVWLLVAVVVVVPVRGRSVTGWFLAATRHLFGTTLRWSSWRSKASQGRVDDLDAADLPGVLSAVEVHDGPPHGPTQTRVAVIQHHAARTWAVTARVTQPGIGMADGVERDRFGNGLSQLLEAASRTELVDEIQLLVRTVPDDGAERTLWLTNHRRPGAPTLARHANDQLQAVLTGAAVRSEAFVTVLVPEARIGRKAREHGRGIDGRARVLFAVMAEVEAQLRGPVGMSEVTWLTSPELAVVCRTGFAPGDRAGIVAALAAHTTNAQVNAGVPWAHAGPSGADPTVRHYSHDAWNSVSATLTLPAKGAVIGALAPVLTPSEPGERRSFLVAFPILAESVADRRTANSEFAADVGDALRQKARIRQRARGRTEAARVRGVDSRLARGTVLTRPYAICTVTAPKTAPIAEYGARLDAAIRRAGFAPLRLDLAHDVGFAASVVPLGVGLTRKTAS